jgi:hypothetical protein
MIEPAQMVGPEIRNFLVKVAPTSTQVLKGGYEDDKLVPCVTLLSGGPRWHSS